MKVLKNILLFIFITASFCSAQTVKDFEGNWAGDLYSFSGSDSKKAASMQLIIAPGDSAGIWQYKMIYNDKDIRNYRLKATNIDNGKFVIDEGDGILLTNDLFGSKFVSVFEVNATMLVITLEKDEDTLVFEVNSIPIKDKKESGKGSNEVPFVYSYPVKNYQKAVLHRK